MDIYIVIEQIDEDIIIHGAYPTATAAKATFPKGQHQSGSIMVPNDVNYTIYKDQYYTEFDKHDH